MNAHTITAEQIARYGEHLREEERAPGTVENYLRNVDRFVFWLAGRAVTREKAVEWKEHLVSCRYAPAYKWNVVRAQQLLFLLWLAGVPGEGAACPAAGIP